MLPNNYRCCPAIVEASNLIVSGMDAKAIDRGIPANACTSGDALLRPTCVQDDRKKDVEGSFGIHFVPYRDRNEELSALARDLSAKLLAGGASGKDTVAVLCRVQDECAQVIIHSSAATKVFVYHERCESVQVRKTFKEFGIPVVSASRRAGGSGGQNTLGLLSFLRLVANPGDGKKVGRVKSKPG